MTAELEEVLAQQAREELTTRREKVTTQSSVIIKLTNPAENTQLHISFGEKAAVGQRPISPFPPPAAVPVPPAPFNPPQAAR